MKRLQSFLLATAMLAAPVFFQACTEEAPEINYTMNVTVINDFSTVVEAINNGTLKSTEAIMKLAEAIDKMNAGEQTKLEAIIDVLNSMNNTLDTKLAAIEAAIKSQTLSLEGKLDLLLAAVENGTIKAEELADKLATAIDNLGGTLAGKFDEIKTLIENTSASNASLAEKLSAIEAAIKAQTLSLEQKLALLEAAINALPDYTEKFEAVVEALGAMKTAVEGLEASQQVAAEKIAGVMDAINDLVSEVKSGSTSAAAALAEIIQKLEELKDAIGGGGGETPVHANTVIIDGVEMPVLSAGIDKSDLEGYNWYDIYLFLSEDKKKYVDIMADGTLHDGKTLDLTRKEEKHTGWYWGVEFRNPYNIFQTFGDPETPYPVFQSGTLLVKRIGTGTEFEITLKDGIVKGEGDYGDGEEHTVSIDFKGELAFDEF